MPFSSPVSDRDCTFGEIMPVIDYLRAVQQGGYIDYDGFGLCAHLDTDGKMTRDASLRILPSQGTEKILPGTTHILWFNK